MDILVVGGSGLVGKHCLKQLADRPEIGTIYSIGRHQLNESIPKVVERIGSPDRYEELMEGLKADAAICTLGTTIRKAGSRNAFEEVDLNLPLHFARAGLKAGVKTYHIVTALGADASSSHFYLRVKGILENELKTLGFRGLHIYRPSLLLGEREEFRLSESIMQSAFSAIRPLYPKILERWKPIDADKVAAFIVHNAVQGSEGIHVWNNDQILSH